MLFITFPKQKEKKTGKRTQKHGKFQDDRYLIEFFQRFFSFSFVSFAYLF